mgnify:FL=1
MANFDPENPLIFERMGSSYYLAGESKKAIESWKRALYLDPTRKDLEAFVKKAQKELEREKDLVNEYFAFRKKKDDKTGEEEDVEMQVLRIVNDSNTAYSYAQEVREQMKGVKVQVEELENGKWAVKTPRKIKKKVKEGK